MIQVSEFIAARGISMDADFAPRNPNMADDFGIRRHFLCTFKSGEHDRQMQVYFSQGSAHRADPTAADVLDCLASDASSVENAKDFEDWAGDLGYDTDSRKAEKIYRVCQQQRDALKEFLGENDFVTLLSECERL